MSGNIDRISAFREMEASCRARGMDEQAQRWQGLAEAAQRDLSRSQAAWAHYQAEDIDPRNQQEEAIEPLATDEEMADMAGALAKSFQALDESPVPVGPPNAAYCWSNEPGHTDGWWCEHKDCAVSPYPSDEEFAKGLEFILDGQEPF